MDILDWRKDDDISTLFSIGHASFALLAIIIGLKSILGPKRTIQRTILYSMH